ncbi:MAG TPA: hypothetical protein VNT79_07465 [Phycisphaerae bacterium]|nr:hypothetical protein [Phycisphaerae bacterium]
MFPAIDPIFVMILNVVISIGLAIFSTLMGAVGSELFTPILESLGSGLGLGSAA